LSKNKTRKSKFPKEKDKLKREISRFNNKNSFEKK